MRYILPLCNFRADVYCVEFHANFFFSPIQEKLKIGDFPRMEKLHFQIVYFMEKSSEIAEWSTINYSMHSTITMHVLQ